MSRLQRIRNWRWRADPEFKVGAPDLNSEPGNSSHDPEDGWALRTPPDEACPKCGAAFDKHLRLDLLACLRGLGAVNDALMAGGPVGDDTPVPTTDRWSVVDGELRYRYAPGAWVGIPRDRLRSGPDGDRAYNDLVALVRRAGATPDLTALLDAAAKAIDPAATDFDRLIAARTRDQIVARLVRSAQNDTDGGNDDE